MSVDSPSRSESKRAFDFTSNQKRTNEEQHTYRKDSIPINSPKIIISLEERKELEKIARKELEHLSVCVNF